jgi:hypothetical protein
MAMTMLVRDHCITFLALSTVLPFFQLRRTHLFSHFILVRVVRLTIEANVLTGTYPSLGKTLNGHESNFLLS